MQGRWGFASENARLIYGDIRATDRGKNRKTWSYNLITARSETFSFERERAFGVGSPSAAL